MSTQTFRLEEKDSVPLIRPSFFPAAGVTAAFTTRRASDGRDLDLDLRGPKDPSLIRENRLLVSRALSLDPASLVLAAQPHSSRVAVVTAADRGRGALSPDQAVPDVDALVTTTPNLPLVALSADCPLVILASENASAVAVAHSGWRSTVAGVIPETLRALASLSLPPSSLFAAIGPSICPSCYQVGPELRAAFDSAFTDTASLFTMVSGHLHLDLAEAVRRQLLAAGLRPERVHAAPYCTACRSDLFYSWRRDGASAGRSAAVVALA